MIKIKDLKKTYNGRPALYNINMEINKGEIIGLFGANGAGKTTLMKCILNFVGYDGEITLDGEKITNKNIERISFATSEHSFFPNLSAADHMAFYKAHFPSFRKERFSALMEFFTLPMSSPLRALSTGQKNQFEVILALSQGAEYILMDEPFAGNDIFNREDFYKVLLGILEPDETILLSTHLIEEVENFVTRAVILKDHKLAADVSVSSLEDEGKSLVSFIKETYSYQPGRVMNALDRLNGQDKEGGQ